MSSPSDAFKKKFRSFKAKNMHDVDWFYLKIIVRRREDSSYNTKIKMQKKYRVLKKASGMDAFIILFFLTLLRLHMIQLVTKKELTI